MTLEYGNACCALLSLAVLCALPGCRPPIRALPQGERASCAALTTDAPAQAILRAHDCPERGPDVLAALWSRHADSADLLPALSSESIQRRDARIYHAVLAVAGQAERPAATRLAAFEVLVAYFDRHLHASREYLTSGSVGDGVPMSAHGSGLEGSVPLPRERSARMQAVFARVAAEDADSVVRRAALKLRQNFAYEDPEHTPVGANALLLTARCGNLVWIRSTADITLPIRIRVLPSAYDHTFYFKAGANNPMLKGSYSFPAGIVVATLGSREIARLTKRDIPCTPETRNLGK